MVLPMFVVDKLPDFRNAAVRRAGERHTQSFKANSTTSFWPDSLSFHGIVKHRSPFQSVYLQKPTLSRSRYIRLFQLKWVCVGQRLFCFVGPCKKNNPEHLLRDRSVDEAYIEQLQKQPLTVR
ncbi:hypothetical protein AWENTII_003991 [Aspergillus wentii]